MFGVQAIPMKVIDRESADMRQKGKIARGLIQQFWARGGREFLQFAADPEKSQLLRNLDWTQDYFEFKDSEVSALIGGKMPIRTTRIGFQAGEIIDEVHGVRRFTKEELLRLMVGAFALEIGISEHGFHEQDEIDQTNAVSDFHRKNPRF